MHDDDTAYVGEAAPAPEASVAEEADHEGAAETKRGTFVDDTAALSHQALHEKDKDGDATKGINASSHALDDSGTLPVKAAASHFVSDSLPHGEAASRVMAVSAATQPPQGGTATSKGGVCFSKDCIGLLRRCNR